MRRSVKTGIVGLVICAVVVVCLLVYPGLFEKKDGLPPKIIVNPGSVKSVAPTNGAADVAYDAARPVNPTYGLEKLVEGYEKELILDAESKSAKSLMITGWTKRKKSGYTRWGSNAWMKSPEYYRKLHTKALVEECFSRGIFQNEMGIYNKPMVGIESLRLFHNGFAELFGREDMWEGILHLYDHLSAHLHPEAELVQIASASGHLDALRYLYLFPPLKDQVKGREKVFLQAHLRVLRKFQNYLNNYDPMRLGTERSRGFFREPCGIASVALLLAKQVDPQEYAKLEPAITRVRWPIEQNDEDLKSFIKLVLNSLDDIALD